MAISRDDQQAPQKPANPVSSLKMKYIGALQSHVINPLRDDLLRMQAQLRGELAQLDLEEAEDREIAQAGLEHEILRIDRVLHVLDLELERLQTLRLSDYNLPGGVAAGAAGLSIQ